jgi:hypothetical protein
LSVALPPVVAARGDAEGGGRTGVLLAVGASFGGRLVVHVPTVDAAGGAIAVAVVAGSADALAAGAGSAGAGAGGLAVHVSTSPFAHGMSSLAT